MPSYSVHMARAQQSLVLLTRLVKPQARDCGEFIKVPILVQKRYSRAHRNRRDQTVIEASD
jgi:hypothetical protein